MNAPYRFAATIPSGPTIPWDPGPDLSGEQTRNVIVAHAAYGLLVGLFPVMLLVFAAAPAWGTVAWGSIAVAQLVLALCARALLGAAHRVDHTRAEHLCRTHGPATLLAVLLTVCVTAVTLAAALVHPHLA